MITTSGSEARGQPDARSADVVLKEGFGAILKEAPKRLKELRDECTAAVERLANAGPSVDADSYFEGLKLACEAAGSPKVVCIALDTIKKLMANGQLTGKGPDRFTESPEGATPRFLMDSIVESVSSCAETNDDSVNLRQIQIMFTAVTSQTIEVHGNSLMLCMQKCMDISRDSKSSMNQRQAGTHLSQMVNTVTQRMELSSTDMARRTNEEAAPDRDKQVATPVHAADPAHADLHSLPPDKLLNGWMEDYVTQVVDKVVLNNGHGPDEVPGKHGWCIICRQPALHYCKDTGDAVCSRECKFRNLERQSLVELHFGAGNGGGDAPKPAADGDAAVPAAEETSTTEAPSSPTGATTTAPTDGVSTTTTAVPRLEASPSSAGFSDEDSFFDFGDKGLNPYHRDALLVFSWLCKLSMSEMPPGGAAGEQRAVRSKRIALELVQAMLQNSGPVVRSSKDFVIMLQRLTCVALIKNSVSSVPKIFGLALDIFVILITNFKEHLRTEIGVFIEQIFLRILESGNSSYQHKTRVLAVFYKLCTDASTALELFLNFDCDVEEKNIFERMIDCLSKIAQGKYTSLEHANLIQPQQEQELKAQALRALVTLMGSIVDWASRMGEDRNTIVTLDSHQNGVKDGADGVDSDAEDDTKSVAASSISAATGNLAEMRRSSFVQQKQRKAELHIGVNKFNMKPKRGIEHLRQNGFITDDPKDVADLFLRVDLGLDKTAIGDYLGEDKPLNKAILYSLVESNNFHGQELDASLRNFLSVFRLPGEAQKVDRMMEKFAEKYCQDNPNIFANADCAFVLSFSLIMLQTDLHNPGVKNKMTKEEFVRNNRGINNGEDLKKEYLEKLYEGLTQNPISLKEDEAAKQRLDSQAAQNASQKADLFVRETESIITTSQELMRKKALGGRSCQYVAAQSTEHIRPLFSVACWPYLATLAVLLEMSDDSSETVERCIEGFKHCIRVAARFDMNTERDAFVSSLAKFTYLTTLKEMKQKNIECIKALLSIGIYEGNHLGPSWQYVLICISQLQRLELIGSHRKQDSAFFADDEHMAQSPGQAQRANSQQQVQKRRNHGLGVSALVSLGSDDRQVELGNSEAVVSQIDSALIERLFNISIKLGSAAIVHFVTQLAKVSTEELRLVDQPRIFSLQKLVEVADYNMKRARLDWQKMWRVLSAHFIEVAKHDNARISMYAIDSLRQLSIKFLDKEELDNFSFQADFLNPFEVIMVSSSRVSREVKDYVVSIIAWMVEKKMSNIKSGWKTVFHILRAAAQEAYETVVQPAFGCIELVLAKQYEIFFENFTDGVQTLLAFGQCKTNLQMSLQSIKHLLKAAEYLAGGSTEEAVADDKAAVPWCPQHVHDSVSDCAQCLFQQAALDGFVAAGQPVPVRPAQIVQATVAAEKEGNRHPAEYWLHILRGLSTLVSDPRRDVRSEALTGLFDVLEKHGAKSFDEDTWRMVFNGVIKPLFDDIHHQLGSADQRKDSGGMESTRSEGTAASWAAHMGPPTCLQALTALTRLFQAHLDSLSFLLDDVLKLIRNCINHDTEAVARIGVEGFKQLLLQTGKIMGPDSWNKVTNNIKHIFAGSMPVKLMSVEVSTCGDQLPFRSEDVVIQCVVQLLLIDMLQETVSQHYAYIPPTGLMTLLDALQSSLEFAQEFNGKIELRRTLKRMGFIRDMKMKQLPGLLKQEREALSCSLKLLFQVQSDERMQESEFAAEGVSKLMRLCGLVLRNYVSKERWLQEQADAPVVDPQADGAASGTAAQEREAAAAEMERELLGLVPIISDVVMKGLKDLRQDQFAKYAPELFPLLCELTAVNSREVREKVREVLLEQVTPIVCAAASPSAEAGKEAEKAEEVAEEAEQEFVEGGQGAEV